uniref:Uncharacterized protein n=1 Tax=Siphoviridae sp. ctYh54 TaxID=2826379 RepID=A0A8S5ME63_9CAUD|nr:MAG TPA: hypothetical protein [Siphoviridae sp. ctYh54]
MRVEKINTNQASFGYSSPLKTLYKEHKLPTVKYGFYGDTLSIKNVSLEHLKAKSKGGVSCLSNYVLASSRQNHARGNDDIREHFNPFTAKRYLQQFIDVKLPRFDGNKYIGMILNTLQKLGINPSFYL